MAQDRLSALDLMHIHYDFDVDEERVVDQFSRKQLCQMELGTLLKD